MNPTQRLAIPRLLLTGAAGALGRELRPRLKPHCTTLRLSDIAPLGAAAPGEEVVAAPLQDHAAVVALLEGVDAVVHLGGISTEKPFDDILAANVVGTYNLYDAARIQGVRRVVFASSNHAIGFYRQDQVLDAAVLPRPDTVYGLSKVWGENVARYHFDRYGIESACLRIGSSFPRPLDRRMLSTWLSYDDLERLVVACLGAPVLGCTVVYGVSANQRVFWDNRLAAHVGYRPQDSSEPFRAELEALPPRLPPDSPGSVLQGGAFVLMGPPA